MPFRRCMSSETSFGLLRAYCRYLACAIVEWMKAQMEATAGMTLEVTPKAAEVKEIFIFQLQSSFVRSKAQRS